MTENRMAPKEPGGWETLEMAWTYAHLTSSQLDGRSVHVTFLAQDDQTTKKATRQGRFSCLMNIDFLVG